jgi:UDP-sulfoquinovose synthase
MRDRLPFPRQAGSFYHWSKVHSSGNAFYCCQVWDLKATDIMQGVVHGVHTEETAQDERLTTRFDFDEVFGTMINRACACLLIGHPMLPYGLGTQTRAYIALRDSIQCLTLSIENPPTEEDSVHGYRVLNQFDECYSCNEIARRVLKLGEKLDMETNITNIENPRLEKEEHFYQPEHQKLYNLGFKPIYPLEEELEITLKILMKYKRRIEAKKARIMPTVYWKKKEKRKTPLTPRAVKTRK